MNNNNNRASDNDCKWSSNTVNLKSDQNFTKIALIFRQFYLGIINFTDKKLLSTMYRGSLLLFI